MAPACDALVLSVCYGFPISHESQWIAEPFLCISPWPNCPALVMSPTMCRAKETLCQGEATLTTKNNTLSCTWMQEFIQFMYLGLQLIFFILFCWFFSWWITLPFPRAHFQIPTNSPKSKDIRCAMIDRSSQFGFKHFVEWKEKLISCNYYCGSPDDTCLYPPTNV